LRLASFATFSLFPTPKENPYTVRIVSTITESNPAVEGCKGQEAMVMCIGIGAKSG